jgi:1-deoxy-D-xylulose-5-phosphate synthase
MQRRLAGIRGPEDLRALTPAQLRALADEIRRKIVDTVASNGGHLGASLGAVELTLAVHTVFRSPHDKIVWDTGHQAYGHKLVTGRYRAFPTIRQPGGLSGFLKRRESVHDVWEAGHAGTSLSAALGLAKARDLQGQSHHVVAIIGDGALTAGLALEALNNIGQSGTSLIVILNDNGMSISRNVGALPAYFARLRTRPAYLTLRDDLNWILGRLPIIGPSMVSVVERVKDGIKHLVLPGMLFEELGFTYLGPVDGHNLPAIQEILREARQVRGPVLCHLVTVKGKGYAPTEARPEASHARNPFDPATGEVFKQPGNPTYTAVFSRTLIRLAEADRRIVGITAAMPDGTGLDRFAERFPDRCFDVGIAEQHAVTFAAGLALAGMRPVVAVYSTFLQRAYDEIAHDVCHQSLPVVFALDRGGLVGADGATHQGVFDFAYLRHLPGMTVMAPKDENELQHMLRTALDHAEGPIAFRFPRGEGVGVPLDPEPRPLRIGEAEVLREGCDVALLAVGPLVYRCLEAADRLAARGVRAAVVNARFVKPLDEALILRLARETGHLVTVEEHVRAGGFGSAVLELLSHSGLAGVEARLLALPDEFIDHGAVQSQLASFGLDAGGIAASALDLLGRELPSAGQTAGA